MQKTDRAYIVNEHFENNVSALFVDRTHTHAHTLQYSLFPEHTQRTLIFLAHET